MNATVSADAVEFAEWARGLLAARPIEHNVLATTLANVGLVPGGAPVFAWALDEDRAVVGLALRTPPRNMLVSTMAPGAAEAIVSAWLEAGAALPGANGPEPAVSYIARAWARQTGGEVRRARAEALYVLEQVSAAVHPPAGAARLARTEDAGLLTDWMHAFCAEAGLEDSHLEASTALGIRQQRMFVWDDGRPRAVVGCSMSVADAVRIGPVYTPPADRRHGFATALVAHVSRRAVDTGADRCLLYADLANPTANGIYQAIGYRRWCDAAEYDFGPPAGAGR